MEPVKPTTKNSEGSKKREEGLPEGSGKCEQTDGSKGKQKSKKHRRSRGKKKHSENSLGNEITRVAKANEETGGEVELEGEERPGSSAIRRSGAQSSDKVKKSDQPEFSSPTTTNKQSSSRPAIQPNLNTPSAHGHTPPTHGHTPPAHGHTPPAHGHTPLAHSHTPSAHSDTPSAHNGTPSKENMGSCSQPKHSSKKKKKKKLYEEYWTKEKVSASLKRNEVHQGILRISAKNYEMAWVSHINFKRDIAIIGVLSRNRALNGDVVAVEISAREKWSVMEGEMRYHENHVQEVAGKLLQLKMTSDEEDPNSEKNVNANKSSGKHERIDVGEIPEKFLQRTAKVVYIVEKKHTRVACGYLRPMANQNDPDGLFSPTDCRLPRFRIPHDLCPPGFFERPQDFEKTLLIARLTEWQQEAPCDSYFARGCFARSLGEAGEIEPETDGILLVNNIDTSPFSNEVLACLPKESPWRIPQEEIESRRDFRDTCVFTIDPATARDLDDALHCIPLEDGMLEVGVHIADVSFFIKEGTALDEVASERATSTYMVQRVIPMLPRLLCEQLCSLNPGQDRLTFSVVWKMDQDGAIQDEWMGKGIIKSRVKLSYQHAQEMIDNPEKVWSENEHPPLSSGASISDVVKCVADLQHIATSLRRKRFESGTLRLDKAKIAFDLDGKTGLPIGWHRYIQRESNKLIEEFMLLANMAVAHRIYDAFPHTALLRSHPKPDARQLEDVEALCKSLQINFSHETSKDIQKSLNTFGPKSPEHLVLSHLAMKPMKPAKYFCSRSAEGDPEKFAHYALSVPLYTHFTSPIRRYPDVIVHRLLAASLKVAREPESSAEAFEAIASQCNDKKLAAKRACEASVELYLGAFIRECGPLIEDGIVVTVMKESIDVLLPGFGIIKRIYFKYCEKVEAREFEEGHKTRPAKVRIIWKSSEDKEESSGTKSDTLTIFTYVEVLLMTENDKKKKKGGLRFVREILPSSAKKQS